MVTPFCRHSSVWDAMRRMVSDCCARIVSGFERIYTRMSRHSVNEVPAMGVNDPTCAGL